MSRLAQSHALPPALAPHAPCGTKDHSVQGQKLRVSRVRSSDAGVGDSVGGSDCGATAEKPASVVGRP